MPARLEKIEDSRTRKGFVELFFSGGEHLRCSANDAADLALCAGMELSDAALDSLRDSCALSSAKEHAARLLSYRAMSRGELRRKLCEKGETPENAEAAVDWLCGMGLMDELSYAKSVVRYCMGKGWGEARIKQEFYRRFVPREYWDEALGELTGEDEAIERFVERRLAGKTPDRRELKKITDALLRRGYSWEQIKQATARYIDNCEDEY